MDFFRFLLFLPLFIKLKGFYVLPVFGQVLNGFRGF